ncbi:type IV pilus modification protein PilV [Pseudomonas putida]
MTSKPAQRGFSLIEVLVAMLIMCIGLLGAAAIQLNALKYTDSSSLRTQASFIAYDMLDRIRTNNTVNYTLASAKDSTATNDTSNPRSLDWYDFKTNIASQLGSAANGSIVIASNVITITITWSDLRAATALNAMGSQVADRGNSTQTFTLVSRAFNDGTATQ